MIEPRDGGWDFPQILRNVGPFVGEAQVIAAARMPLSGLPALRVVAALGSFPPPPPAAIFTAAAALSDWFAKSRVFAGGSDISDALSKPIIWRRDDCRCRCRGLPLDHPMIHVSGHRVFGITVGAGPAAAPSAASPARPGFSQSAKEKLRRDLGIWLGSWSEPSSPPPSTKQRWFVRARDEFGAGLTRNLFEAVWAKADLPAALRRPGRR